MCGECGGFAVRGGLCFVILKAGDVLDVKVTDISVKGSVKERMPLFKSGP